MPDIFGGGSPQQTVQTTNSAPWTGAQPYLTDVLKGAQTAYKSGKGFDYPGFNTTIPFSPQSMQALQGTEARANAGNPLGAATENAALGLLNNWGQTPGMSAAGAGYGDVAGGAGAPSGIRDNLMGYASGANVNGGSPEFLKALDYQAGRTADDVNRGFSNAGRFGSEAHRTASTEAVGNLRNSAIASEIAREQGQQIQAAGMLSGEQGQGTGYRLGALGGMGQIGAQGAGNLATFTGLAPNIYEQGFAPYGKLAGVGAANEDLATRTMNEKLGRFNAGQQNDWARLAAYNALIGGAGQLGGTTSTSVPKPSPIQGLLSGGLTGASLGAPFGLPGMAIGGGLGALAGLF